MDSKQARKLFEKYLNNECSPQEQELLERFLDSFQDGKLWSEFEFDDETKARIWSDIRMKTDEEKGVVRNFSFSNLFKYAAVIAGLAVGVYFWIYLGNSGEPSVPVDDKIVLRMGGDTYNELEIGTMGEIRNAAGEVIASQQGDMVVYKRGGTTSELVYNEIEVPMSKTFKLILSDGTSVHLNSGTTFRFPANFIDGLKREVFLKGEAYFEVAKNTDQPFLVKANDMDVRVLGTHFVVSSYAGSISHAVLLEGSVSVQQDSGGDEGGRILVPGQRASLISGNIAVEEVDVNDYVAWRQGLLIFNNELFSEIIKKIERKYDVDIENHDPELATARFNGKFKDETLADLLETFRESAGFQFRIEGGKVVIE